MVYKWREGARRRGSAQDVGRELDAIRVEADGSLTPPAVVDAARDDATALHKHFQWDDTLAAQDWRLHQARELIGDVMVVYAEIEGAPKEPVRAFASANDGANTAYHSTIDAMRSPLLRASVLEQAKKELDGWRRRYRHYQELARAVELADEAAKAIPEPVAA